MTTFGPINDLFSNPEDRLRLLESQNIKVARLDAFKRSEQQFNSSVVAAKQSLEQQGKTNLAQNQPPTAPTTTNSQAKVMASHLLEETPVPHQPKSLEQKQAQPPKATEKLEERIKTIAEKNEASALVSKETALPSGNSTSTVSNIIDVINPLQHIPFVNLVYREATGDTISQGSKIAGGTLFGGLLGGVGAIAAATGIGVGFASGTADAAFSSVSGVETSRAAAMLYNGESFEDSSRTVTTKNIQPTDSIRSEEVTFDARHVYSDVLKKFGTDIDVLLAQSPDNYGAELVYANAIAHVGSLSARTLQASIPEKINPNSPQDVLARLHSPVEDQQILADDKQPQQANRILSKANPLEIKQEALERLANVRQQIEKKSQETDALNLAPQLSSTSDISSMIERRLSQLIKMRSDTHNQTNTVQTGATTEEISEATAPVINTIARSTAAYTPSATSNDAIATAMQERLEAFNLRQQQQITKKASEHVVTDSQLPSSTDVRPATTDGVSQVPEPGNYQQEEGQAETLASAMRDAFSRFRANTLASR